MPPFWHFSAKCQNKHVQGHGDQPKHETGKGIIVTVDLQVKKLVHIPEKRQKTKKESWLYLKTFSRHDTLQTFDLSM